MAKPSSSDVQLVVPGQPSDKLLSQLRQIGERVTDEQLISAFDQAEAQRSAFQSQAIVCGIYLLAKRESMRHGQWLPWSEKFAAQAVAKLAARCQFEQRPDLTARSLRVYVQVAQHFLADLEQKSFAPEATDLRVQPPAVAPEDVLAIETLPQDRRVAVMGAIETFVAGRSLRRMLTDFRRAENAAEHEEAEAAEAAARRKRKAEDAAPGQMEFYAEMLRPIGEVEALFEDKTFVSKTDKEFWTQIANKLEAQAAKARKLAQEIAA